MTAAIPTGWPVPGGVARAAPIVSPAEYFDTLVEVVTLRAAATAIERWHEGWYETGPQTARIARLLAPRELPLEPERWRAEAVVRAGALAKRLVVSEPPALVAACAAWGLDDTDREIVAALLAYELSPLAALLMRQVGDASDAEDAPLRIAGLAGAVTTGSPALVCDRIATRLVSRGLAALTDDRGPVLRWRVRAGRRWLPLVAGRLALDEDAGLHALPGDPLDPAGRLPATRAAVARRPAGAPLVTTDAPPAALAAALLHDRRPALFALPRAAIPAILREALLFDAGVVVDAHAPPADLAALVHHPITIIISTAGTHVDTV